MRALLGLLVSVYQGSDMDGHTYKWTPIFSRKRTTHHGIWESGLPNFYKVVLEILTFEMLS